VNGSRAAACGARPDPISKSAVALLVGIAQGQGRIDAERAHRSCNTP